MYTHEFSRSELRELLGILFRNHAVRTRLEMLDLNHNHIGSISNALVGGSVQGDTTGDNYSRSLSLDLFDPKGDLNLDRFNPSEGTMYLDRMIRAYYCIGRLDGSRWFEIPVFTGPVTKVDRDDYMLSVECSGKEILSSDPLLKGKTYHKGWLRTALVKAIMSELAGEVFLRITKMKGRTGDATPVNKDRTPFGVSKTVMTGNNAIIYYDGMGYLRSRRRRSKSVFTFTKQGVVTSPQIGYNLDDFYNVVVVVGAKPKHAKKKVSYTAVAPASHPLSPQSLKRGGVPRRRVLRIEDGSLKTKAECKAVALKRLQQGLDEQVSITLEVGVHPLLEEYDVVTINTDTYHGRVLVKQWTIPLVVGDGNNMSLGFNKSVKPRRLRRRKVRRK